MAGLRACSSVLCGLSKEIRRMQQSLLNQNETADNAVDNPALSNVIERNIRTIMI